RKLGTVVIQTSPSDAEVYLDGQLVGLTPIPLEDIVAGKRKLRVQKADYKPVEKEIEVLAAERSEIYFELEILDEIPARIIHTPVRNAQEGSSLRLSAQVEDNLGVTGADLFYRKAGAGNYEKLSMYQARPGQFEGMIPKEKVAKEGLEYYIEAADIGGNRTQDGRPDDPYRIMVRELDTEPPAIFHEPVQATSDASQMVIKASVMDNKTVAAARVFFRRATDKAYVEDQMKPGAQPGEYIYTLPEMFMAANRLEYFIAAEDDSGNKQYSGREDSPFVVSVVRVLPFKEGYIVERKIEGGEPTRNVRVNIGTLKGAQNGQVFTVFNADEQIIDPDTGMILAINQRLTGKIKITRADLASSAAEIVKEYEKFAVKKGDLIRLRPSPPVNVGGYSEKFRVITVSWKMSPEPEVRGYVVYRSESKDGPFDELTKISRRETFEAEDKGTYRTPLVDGKKYFYKVRAYNDEKEMSDYSETGFVIAKGGPNPPTNLSATSGEIRRITLSWMETRDEEAYGYKVERAEAEEGPWAEIADLRVRDKKLVDKPDLKADHQLLDAKTYWYRIVSYNSKGKIGNPTEPVFAASRPRPAIPANPQLVSSSVRSLTIAWERHADADVNRYAIYRSQSADGDYKLIKEIRDRSTTEYTDEDKSGVEMKDSQTYFYRIMAINSGGAESELSPPISGTTFGPPEAPGNIAAASGLVKQTLLTWTAPKDPKVTGYQIYRGGAPEAMSVIKKIMDPATTQYKDAGSWTSALTDGTRYFYSVRSFNIAGVENSDPKILEVVTKPVPAAPKGLSAASGQPAMVTLSWEANPEPDIVSYSVLRADKADGRFNPVATAKQTSHEDKGLDHGKEYFYQIQAMDKDGLKGQLSEPVSARTKQLPPTPTAVKATGAEGSAELEWEAGAAADVARYDVYSTGLLGKDKVASAKENSCVVKGLKSGTYNFIVIAVDGDGLESAPSAPISVKIK
ncbi:MAG: PEGA domain-containing protein, partial [Nitrospinota bacterium]|nr:PEGA domain-containing protein [Nitrospinota bacterium]